MRTTNTFARLGGDEFAILLDDVAGMSGFSPLLKKSTMKLNSPLK